MMLNGEEQPDVDISIAALLKTHHLRTTGIAVALNGEVVPRSLWEETMTTPGCVVEILTAAAGG